MASPAPNSSPSAVPPSSTNNTATTPPPQNSTSSPPPQPSPSPPSPSSEPNASPPDSRTPSTSSPPPQSPPPVTPSPPPPVATPPTPSGAPPPSSPPPSSPPPTPTSSPPPPSTSSPPPPEISPAPPSNPPASPPPPPSSTPPEKSPPPPSSTPPETSPPPPSSKPPENSPPPPSKPPENSPPPPSSPSPPEISPQPPASIPRPPPPPSSTPRTPPPPPPRLTPTPPGSQPIASPPPPSSLVSPPSPSIPAPPSNIDPPANNSSPIPPLSPPKSNGIGTAGVAAISVVAGLIGFLLIGLAIWYWCVRKQQKKVSGLNGGHIMPSSFGSSPKSGSSFTKAYSSAPLIGTGSGSTDFAYSPTEPGGLGNSRPWFTYDELVKATNGFSAQNLLGEGGFGAVYKGYLPDERVVAVKQLKIGGGQGEREFKAEVETISRIHHRHLVSLVGYCISENQRLLVYEYVPNNTLYFHLHGQGRPVLDWATRVKVAVGAARGIAYLHEDCHPRIIHRDIKSSNILLDNNFEARVSDFGLAKLALDMYTHITTRVMGTFGYMAPEYASSGKLTEKSDVYSFGVVLLELITGRKPVDTSQPLGDESLVEWARPLLSHALDSENFEGLADPRLEGNYVESEMFRMIEAAAACVRHSAAKRPRMGQVARAFDSLGASDLTNGMRPGESEVFNSAQQSAEIRLFWRMGFGSQNYSTDFFSQDTMDV